MIKEIKDKQVLTLIMPGELVKRIDNYRFDRHFNTRSEAIRFLLDYAVKQNPER